MQGLGRFALTSLLVVLAAGCDSGTSPDVVYALDDVAPRPTPLIGWSTASLLYEYPEFARRAGIDGAVRVSVVVGRDGTSQDPEIQSSPNELLSEHALATVRALVWEPGEVDGAAVRVRGDVCAQYELEGTGVEAVGSTVFGWCGS